MLAGVRRPEGGRGGLARLARKIEDALALRQRRKQRGKLDPKRTFRSNLQYGGVPIELHWRRRHREKPRLVTLCDVSDSVRNASRLMLELVCNLFAVEVLVCPRCAGPRRILGAVTEPHAVRRLLASLELTGEPPPGGGPAPRGRSVVPPAGPATNPVCLRPPPTAPDPLSSPSPRAPRALATRPRVGYPRYDAGAARPERHSRRDAGPRRVPGPLHRSAFGVPGSCMVDSCPAGRRIGRESR